MRKGKSENGQTINDWELQVLLMERAERLHKYVQRRLPADVQGIVAPEDILQEMWLAVFRGIANFRADAPDALDRWLTKIAERKLIDAIRSARTVKRGGGHRIEHEARCRTTSYLALFARVVSKQRTPSSEDAAREATHAVQIALCSLPDDCQLAVRMRHIEGRPRAEVAEAMEKSRPAINSLLFHGLRMLRDQLGPAGRFFSNGG